MIFLHYFNLILMQFYDKIPGTLMQICGENLTLWATDLRSAFGNPSLLLMLLIQGVER